MKILALLAIVTLSWGNATVNYTAEMSLRDMVIAEHARLCSNTLTIDNRLVWLARYRSMDMGLNKYFTHTNPFTNKRVFDLMHNAGISYSIAGEDLVWNNYDDRLSASEAYTQLMASASHRAIIQSCSFTRLGVGDYKIGTKKLYTLLFIKP